jgi:hypothetical protein
MKFFKKNILTAIVCGLLFSSCDEDVLVSSGYKANVQFVNVIQNAPTMSVNVRQIPLITGLPYGVSSGYRSVEAGRPQSFQIINAEGANIGGANSYTLGQNGNYTIFAFTSANRLTLLPLIDSLKTEPAGKVRFRFAHLDESVEEVEAFLLKEGTTELIAPFPFSYYSGENSQYAAIEPGVYSFILREPGSDVDVARLDNIQFSTQKNYTFYTYNSGGVMQLRSLEIPTK